MSEQTSTIFLYEFFTTLTSSDIVFDTLQISYIPPRELIVDLYQILMRAKTLVLNGRESLLSFPVRNEPFFNGEPISSFIVREIRLKGVGLNLNTTNLYKNIERVTITETK
jgi:hypothetical protein